MTGPSGGPSPTPPGWYPDPAGTGATRYWDGIAWTGHVADAGFRAPAVEKTSGFAIASLVFGIVGGPLLAIPFGLVAKSRIKQSGGRLRGRGMATWGIGLGCAWLALIVTSVVLVLAGVFDTPSNASRYEGVEREVAATVDDTQEAFSDGDGTFVCDQIFTDRFAGLITFGGEEPCAEQFDLEDGEIQVDITVKRIVVSGDTATVDVEEGDTPERWTMVRVNGRWRIDNIESESS